MVSRRQRTLRAGRVFPWGMVRLFLNSNLDGNAERDAGMMSSERETGAREHAREEESGVGW